MPCVHSSVLKTRDARGSEPICYSCSPSPTFSLLLLCSHEELQQREGRGWHAGLPFCTMQWPPQWGDLWRGGLVVTVWLHVPSSVKEGEKYFKEVPVCFRNWNETTIVNLNTKKAPQTKSMCVHTYMSMNTGLRIISHKTYSASNLWQVPYAPFCTAHRYTIPTRM